MSGAVVEEKTTRKASVQSVCKKIGESVRKIQNLAATSGNEEKEVFDKALTSLQKTSRRLREGLLKYPDCSDALRAG
jgi:hypothetical protein